MEGEAQQPWQPGNNVGGEASDLLMADPGLPSLGSYLPIYDPAGLNLNARKTRFTLWSMIYILVCIAELNWIDFAYSNSDHEYLTVRIAGHIVLLSASLFLLIQNACAKNPRCFGGGIVLLFIAGGILQLTATILGTI